MRNVTDYTEEQSSTLKDHYKHQQSITLDNGGIMENETTDQCLKILICDSRPGEENACNTSCNEEGVQNTPPKIKQKMHQLASKNKFSSLATKPKATIDISVKVSS